MPSYIKDNHFGFVSLAILLISYYFNRV